MHTHRTASHAVHPARFAYPLAACAAVASLALLTACALPPAAPVRPAHEGIAGAAAPRRPRDTGVLEESALGDNTELPPGSVPPGAAPTPPPGAPLAALSPPDLTAPQPPAAVPVPAVPPAEASPPPPPPAAGMPPVNANAAVPPAPAAPPAVAQAPAALPPGAPPLAGAPAGAAATALEPGSLISLIRPDTPPNVAAALRIIQDGREQMQAGHFDRALERFERAVAIDPTNAYGYYFLAQLHYRTKKYDQAIAFASRAVVLSARGDAVWLARAYDLEGQVFEDAGRYPDARTAYEKAAAADPNNLAARVGVARLGGTQ